MRVVVKPALLRWAHERAGVPLESLLARFPQLRAWLSGEASPTLKQLERFASATHAPIGFFFLPEPPVETVPIPDFRTLKSAAGRRPSPDLLDTVYVCQQRQDWFREHARAAGEPSVAFVGAATVDSDVVETAARMRDELSLNIEARAAMSTWTEALRRFIEEAEAAGVLVMVSGIVGNNTHRKLSPDEFRGFALADEIAPLVFINGADTKAAQMFTLAHELAHLWLGQTAVSDAAPVAATGNAVETWCNRVAAEVLIPLEALRIEYRTTAEVHEEAARLARRFKVSTLVALRRMHDAGGLTRQRLWAVYEEELRRIASIERPSGGNFYLTQAARVGKRFARALIASTLEGQTLHRDAFRLLGFSRLSTFRDLGQRLGVI